MKTLCKYIVIAGMLTGSIVEPAKCSTLPALACALGGDALYTIAVVSMIQNNHPFFEPHIPPSMRNLGLPTIGSICMLCPCSWHFFIVGRPNTYDKKS